jgi:ferrous iron transport protein A
MEGALIPLNRLAIGKLGRVKYLTALGEAKRRMLDLGLVADTPVEALRKSLSGDPTAYRIRGAVIALRSEEASKILVEID